MPVIRQRRYYRIDARNNPSVLYVFGDNDARKGYGGQAAEMLDEPNAVGVRTKKTPGHSYRSDYYTDHEYDANMRKIEEDFRPIKQHLARGGIVVIPSDGLGTGLSDLEQYAPITGQKLNQMVADLCNMNQSTFKNEDHP